MAIHNLNLLLLLTLRTYPFYLVLCLLVSPAIHGYAAEPAKLKKEIVKKEKQLESLKREIVEKKRSLEYNVKKEYAILEGLERLDKALSKKEEELEKIENSLVVIKQKNSDVDIRIKELIQERIRLMELLKQRLVAMYKMNRAGITQSIFAPNFANEFSRRYKYVNKVIDHDTTLLKDYNENQLLLEAEKIRLKEFQEEIGSLKDAVEKKKEEIKEEKDKKKVLLNDIKKKKEIQIAAIEEMESAGRELQLFIDRLKNETVNNPLDNETNGFASMRGHLPMPVAGKVISMYGKVEHPKFHTVTFNNGIEVEAAMGAEVKSVYKGHVVYSGWFRGYGKVLIIDHGNGYHTLFGRLSKILAEVNSTVERDDIIALVGDTGSIKGPHLYFEIRQKGVPLDPVNWLTYDKTESVRLKAEGN
ncbi:MAG: hypothetical protein A2X87_01365 [Deltaproteobacteria bacterium GWC2_42_51]|nr:MAG: hypothetical protein A2056_01800 [Deltaproteobacteria bacterium GWA2_42_85]OGP34715.1 MAG: hypothetical protein A2X87_01365 [Deltaproteobacteria bacterium GWC2_42_51]OGP41221.1 MAG: hypothetical protein A2090_02305 [Deltaproteobacteria bacterium GWD2_42_10]OGP48947.1 MAG: hypothetical protein A2022_01725 [Deltaproteobacteria bacterium GWF2_42_12]OGQ27876.1 MAG: hypothetical protein A3D29_01400 [Deltaproteobacteria bacterium RIFCSPHIGHO2_02_FULL_42_44]OGQ70090.1 MAG: hypothetical protei